jgi:hypothetical protein
MPNAHQRDPVGGEWWYFVDRLIDGDGEKEARRWYDLAIRYQITFKEIFNMIVAALQEHYDLQKEFEEIGEEGKRNADLLRLKLPIQEALQIWKRSRDGLLRLAELCPDKREKIEAAVAEQQDVLLAMFERYERKQGAN